MAGAGRAGRPGDGRAAQRRRVARSRSRRGVPRASYERLGSDAFRRPPQLRSSAAGPGRRPATRRPAPDRATGLAAQPSAWAAQQASAPGGARAAARPHRPVDAQRRRSCATAIGAPIRQSCERSLGSRVPRADVAGQGVAPSRRRAPRPVRLRSSPQPRVAPAPGRRREGAHGADWPGSGRPSDDEAMQRLVPRGMLRDRAPTRTPTTSSKADVPRSTAQSGARPGGAAGRAQMRWKCAVDVEAERAPHPDGQRRQDLDLAGVPPGHLEDDTPRPQRQMRRSCTEPSGRLLRSLEPRPRSSATRPPGRRVAACGDQRARKSKRPRTGRNIWPRSQAHAGCQGAAPARVTPACDVDFIGSARPYSRESTMPTPEQQHREALAGHADRLARYPRGEIPTDSWRPIRLSYGLYYQLDHTSHMQRIKIPGGLLTAEQLDAMADVADRYGRGIAHVTTRQDIQIHWVPLEQIIDMYERLLAVDITTRGACADSVRNVTGCPYAGVHPDEPFDVAPYVLAIHDYFLFNPLNLTLPRKFKIAVEGCPEDCAQVPVNDIGALRQGCATGCAASRVWAGGGLGAQPFLAKPVADFVPAEDLLVWCEAIVRVQHRHGERKNRSRARMKYVVKKMGLERFRELVEERGARGRRRARRGAAGGAARARRRGIQAPGIASCCRSQPSLRSPASTRGGAPTSARSGRTATARSSCSSRWATSRASRCVPSPRSSGRTATGRCAPPTTRTSSCRPIPEPALPAVHAALVDIGLGNADAGTIIDVVSCPGMDYCSLAITRSMGVAERVRAHLLDDPSSGDGLCGATRPLHGQGERLPQLLRPAPRRRHRPHRPLGDRERRGGASLLLDPGRRLGRARDGAASASVSGAIARRIRRRRSPPWRDSLRGAAGSPASRFRLSSTASD